MESDYCIPMTKAVVSCWNFGVIKFLWLENSIELIHNCCVILFKIMSFLFRAAVYFV